jgi:hypothetical protein
MKSMTKRLVFGSLVAVSVLVSCGGQDTSLSVADDQATTSNEVRGAERCNPAEGQFCRNNNFCSGSLGFNEPSGVCGFRPAFPRGPIGSAGVGALCNAYDRVYCQRGLLCTNSGMFESGRCVRPDAPLRNPERYREAGEACNRYYAVVCKWPSECLGSGGGENAPFINGKCVPSPIFSSDR